MTKALATDQIQRYFDKHAQGYDRQMGFFERHLLGEHRRWATSRASGDVVELAVGTGLNLPLYPESVRHVVGIELSDRMLEVARQRITSAGLVDRVEVRQGDVEQLALPDGCADTVVSTYTMCTIPRPQTALAEAWRVLRPGGRMVLVEHGPGARGWVRAGQRLLNPLSVRFQADDILRDPLPLVVDAGFEVVEADRAGWAGLVHRVLAVKAEVDAA